MDKQPAVGDIAYCRANFLGLILLVDEDATINNVPTTIYRGIHLEADKLGQPWQSTDPVVVGHIEELLTPFKK